MKIDRIIGGNTLIEIDSPNFDSHFEGIFSPNDAEVIDPAVSRSNFVIRIVGGCGYPAVPGQTLHAFVLIADFKSPVMQQSPQLAPILNVYPAGQLASNEAKKNV